MSITNTWLKSNCGKVSKGCVKADRDNLSVRVSPKGAISFVLRFRFNGKDEQFTIGKYPVMTLEEAREKALKYQRLISEGENPRIAEKLAKASVKSVPSFKTLFDRWYSRECLGSVKDATKIYAKFEKDIFPEFGDIPADKLTVSLWMDKLEEVKDRAPSVAAVLLTNIRKAYNYAAKREVVDKNPLQFISAAEDLKVKQVSKETMLDDNQISTLLKAMTHLKLNKRNVLFTKLCLITGCRPNELRLAKKDHFDMVNNIWTVPAENHKIGGKTGKPLKRPIVEGMKEVIVELMELNNSEYLLINDKTGELLKDNFWTTIPKRFNSYAKKMTCQEIGEWSIYDLRKTMRTNVSRLAEPWVAEIMIGHTLGKVFRIYDQNEYLEEQREAYTAWVNKLKEF
jgi:integrase